MESTGIPGKIQVTKEVVKQTADTFIFDSRGLVNVKGKGEMEGFILKGPKSDKEAILRPSLHRKTNRESVFSSLRSLDSARHIRDLIYNKIN